LISNQKPKKIGNADRKKVRESLTPKKSLKEIRQTIKKSDLEKDFPVQERVKRKPRL